LRIYNAR